MPRLPNIDAAVLDVRKLSDYCLDPTHPRGRHKARVFRQTLGIGNDDAGWLMNAIPAALSHAEAVELERDTYGARWRVDVSLTRQNWQAVVGLSGYSGPGNASPGSSHVGCRDG